MRTELWSEAWFGSAAGSEHHAIATGRFAGQQVSKVGESSSVPHSPYGYLRAPWNLNPSPYVTRYHKLCGVAPDETYYDDSTLLKEVTDYKWPTCGAHWKLTFGEKTWEDWVWASSYTPHGPVHAWIGGVGGGGCEDDSTHFKKLVGLMSSRHITLVRMNIFGFLKNAWRDEVVETPKSCSVDAVDECVFKCNKESSKFLSTIKTSLKDWEIEVENYDNETILQIADVILCDAVYWPGDHLEAASPVEASFWPIHPTLDRLLQYKSLVFPFKSTAWTGQMCFSSETTDCKGHNPGDLTYWPTGSWLGSILLRLPVAFCCFRLLLVSPARV